MTSKTTIFLKFTLILFCFFCISCNTEKSQNSSLTLLEDSVKSEWATDTSLVVKSDSSIAWKYKMFINHLPFPFRLLDDSRKADFLFDKNNMNPVNNLAKYHENRDKAINLGIYGADIAYIVINEQYNETGNYVKTTKRLAEELSIPNAIMEEGFMKFLEYRDNKDSLIKIIYESYHRVDTMLKSNEQYALAGLVVTGCWLEGFYLSTKPLLKSEKYDGCKDLLNTVTRQKFYLGNILNLLNEFRKDQAYNKIVVELESLKRKFDALPPQMDVNPEELVIILKDVERLRNSFIDAL